MGQAKKRGTFEERRDQAIETHAEELRRAEVRRLNARLQEPQQNRHRQRAAPILIASLLAGGSIGRPR